MMAFSSGLRVPTISAQRERDREAGESERRRKAGRGPRFMREEQRLLWAGSQTLAPAWVGMSCRGFVEGKGRV